MKIIIEISYDEFIEDPAKVADMANGVTVRIIPSSSHMIPGRYWELTQIEQTPLDGWTTCIHPDGRVYLKKGGAT